MINIARLKNPNRDKALEIYIKNKGNIKPSDIATQLKEKPANIRTWKHVDKWDEKLPRPGAPKGNKNAKGNKGGGAPKGNFNAVKHGMYMPDERLLKGNLDKILPKSILNTMKELCNESPLDKLWRSILMQEAKILHMQNIIYIENRDDTTKVLSKISKGNVTTNEFEIQFAWDKENSAMSTLSKAMKALSDMIKQFEEMAHKNWDLISEEQKLKIELLKHKLSADEDEEIEDDGFIDALKSEVDNVWD